MNWRKLIFLWSGICLCECDVFIGERCQRFEENVSWVQTTQNKNWSESSCWINKFSMFILTSISAWNWPNEYKNASFFFDCVGNKNLHSFVSKLREIISTVVFGACKLIKNRIIKEMAKTDFLIIKQWVNGEAIKVAAHFRHHTNRRNDDAMIDFIYLREFLAGDFIKDDIKIQFEFLFVNSRIQIKLVSLHLDIVECFSRAWSFLFVDHPTHYNL